MRRTQAKIGWILIAAGVLILAVQVILLTTSRTVSEHRTEVLSGNVEYAGGERSVRPVLSVLGVVCLAGGLFTVALSGNATKKGP